MADAIIKPFFQEWLSSSRLLANFASKIFLKVNGTFVASRSITLRRNSLPCNAKAL